MVVKTFLIKLQKSPTMRSFFFLVLLNVLVLRSQGQIPSLGAYQAAAESIVLLTNKNEIIPIEGLDTVRLGVINFTGKSILSFLETAQKYTPHVEEVQPVTQMGRQLAQEWASQQAQKYDLIILAIQDQPYQGRPSNFMFKRTSIKEIMKRVQVLTLLFDAKDGIRQMPELGDSEALLVAPYEGYGPALAAQTFFGGHQITNRLAQTLHPRFKKGTGLYLDQTRLGYAPPFIANMNEKILQDSISSIIQEGIDSMAYPGAQVLVARHGKVIYHQAFGFHTYEKQRLVFPEDIYDLASVTKVSSGLAALMRWYGTGKLDLDAPLSTYFDGFGKKSNKDELTLRHILAHNAQLRPWIPYWQGTLKENARYPWQKDWDTQKINDYNFRKKTFARNRTPDFSTYITDSLWLHRSYQKAIYKAIRKSPLNEKPGYVYSGLFFYLLPEIVADLSQQDYETYLKQTFYKPLGAFTLTYNPLRYFAEEQIIPTERDTFFRMQLLRGTVHDEGAAMMGGVSANAGLFASANDLAKLWQMYLNQGQYGNRQYISAKALNTFTACAFCESNNHRGLGFDKPLLEYDPQKSTVAKKASPNSFGHSGYTGTFVWVDPDEDLLFIFLSNRVYPTRLNRKLYTLGIRPRLHAALYRAIRN